jgi:hypothetical protein
VRTNRLRTYAASGFVRAALTAGSYGVVTHGSGTDAPTRGSLLFCGASNRHLPACAPSASAVPPHLTHAGPPAVLTPPVVPPPPPPRVVPTSQPARSLIPQGGGGDGDPDNFGPPSDGDGNV